MPCDTISTAKVDLGNLPSPELLEQTLSDLGLNPQREGQIIYFGNGEQVNLKTGKAKLQWNRSEADLKQAHSKTILQSQAKRFGWAVQQVQVAGENPTFKVRKAVRL